MSSSVDAPANSVVPDIPLAELKRLFERSAADADFRQRLVDDPAGAAAEYGFTWDPAFLGPMLQPGYAAHVREHGEGEVHPVVRRWRERMADKLRERDAMRSSALPSNPAYRQWRERQKARLLLDLGEARAASIVHAPMCFELNKGCSVGCWFCGIAAPRLTDIWAYTPENAALWQAVLRTMLDVVGPAARWGFCYWATDPLDNPDYERFMIDYHGILGTFPQTTTALALRDPARTRALLALSAERGCHINRFSILTLKKLLEVHAQFTPEELADVECIPQNAESAQKLSRAGKAAERPDRVNKRGESLVTEHSGTIACVSGFQFNMVERTVKLMAPCATNERWPLGYMVFEEAAFGDADELRHIVQGMIDRHMPASVRQLPTVAFTRCLRTEVTDEGLVGVSDFTRIAFPISNKGWVREVERLVRGGGLSADDIALLCLYGQGVATEQTIELLENLFRCGLIDEEPPAEREARPAAAPSPSPAAAYLSLFTPSAPTQSEASRAFHAQAKQPSDDVLWISRLRPPRPRGHLRRLLADLGVTPRGVLHLGAHWGFELEAYLEAGFERVVFFEASPLALPHLERHVAFWNEWLDVFTETWKLPTRPRIDVVPRAVCDRAGSAPMHAAELEMLSSLLPPAADWIKVQQVVQVETGTLDGLLAERGWRAADFNVMNIDVQGAELQVLQGAADTLPHLQAMIVELDEHPRYVGGASAAEVDERLRALGFVSRISADRGSGVRDAVYARA